MVGPEQTLRRLEPLKSPLGITRVARIGGLDNLGIPTSICVRPNARHLCTSQGKGATPELADVSAIMESVEGFHAENVPPPDEFFPWRRVAAGGRHLDPRLLPPGPRWRAWSAATPLRWVQAYSLEDGRPMHIPYIAVTLDGSVAHPEFGIIAACSNGLASGNTFTEAACHALYELIERDADYHWERQPAEWRMSRRVDLQSVRSEVLRDIIEQIRSARVEPLVWEITGRTSVPAFRCVLASRDEKRPLGRFHGSGAHLSPEIALSRAITEAAQSRLTWIHGTREDIFPSLYDDLPRSASAPLDLPRAVRRFDASATPFFGATFDEDLAWLIQRLAALGHDKAFVYDHTREDIGIPVVSLFVPGLRFSGNRF
ncbi:MAG: YcaO-like family protein [Reyranellaceae bacterium]